MLNNKDMSLDRWDRISLMHDSPWNLNFIIIKIFKEISNMRMIELG